MSTSASLIVTLASQIHIHVSKLAIIAKLVCKFTDNKFYCAAKHQDNLAHFHIAKQSNSCLQISSNVLLSIEIQFGLFLGFLYYLVT